MASKSKQQRQSPRSDAVTECLQEAHIQGADELHEEQSKAQDKAREVTFPMEYQAPAKASETTATIMS